MKIPSTAAPSPSLWPENKAGVLAVANGWYDPGRVAVDEQAIASLSLPPIKVGAEPSMAAGKLGMEWQNNVALSLALNSINYQFWDLDTEGKFVRYRFEGIEGAMGMRTAFERAWADPDSPLSAARAGGASSIGCRGCATSSRLTWSWRMARMRPEGWGLPQPSSASSRGWGSM